MFSIVFNCFLRFFLEQTFRPTTFIPDACGGRAENSHRGLTLEPRGRGGTPSKNVQKAREPSKMGGVGSTLVYFRHDDPRPISSKKSPGDGKTIFRNVQPLGMICTHNIKH